MKVKDLHFQHKKNSPYFFKGVSFELEKRKIHALHGKNGAGKSVRLNLLSGKPTPQAVVKGWSSPLKNRTT